MTVKLVTCCSFAIGLLVTVGVAAPASAQSSSPTAEARFLAENEAAMQKMMADMNVKSTGNVDRDFVAMMIPHHQGAIEMAKAMLRYGHNEQLRRLAQEIIVTQQQEIVTMRLAIGETAPPAAAPTSPQTVDGPHPALPDHSMSHDAMHMKPE